jgi:hypothetical protein
MGPPAVASATALPQGRGNPLNGNILVRGGRETNWDSLSSSERRGKSSNRIPQGDLWEMWGCGPEVLPNRRSRSDLERSVVEGDSPVGVSWKVVTLVPEYQALILVWEAGRHQLPKLNTFRDR